MDSRTEIIFNDECIHNANDIIPLNKGDEFYFSIREFYPKDEKKFRRHTILRGHLLESYLDDIKNQSKKFHIKYFKVVNKSFSVQRDYSQYLNDENKESNVVLSLTVKEVPYWKRHPFRYIKNRLRKLFN